MNRKNSVQPTILMVIRSGSSDRYYEIRKSNNDGKTYCTCGAWKNNRNCEPMPEINATRACKHMRANVAGIKVYM